VKKQFDYGKARRLLGAAKASKIWEACIDEAELSVMPAVELQASYFSGPTSPM
jgi:hypothetical protein